MCRCALPLRMRRRSLCPPRLTRVPICPLFRGGWSRNFNWSRSTPCRLSALEATCSRCRPTWSSFKIRESDPITVRALASQEEPYALLGRDVLNRFAILLDGPNLAIECVERIDPVLHPWREACLQIQGETDCVLHLFQDSPVIWPAGRSENLLGSSERIWKQRNTVSRGSPLSSDETRTFVG
jgi:hypothetical protein